MSHLKQTELVFESCGKQNREKKRDSHGMDLHKEDANAGESKEEEE